ncbi:hypothetical protein NCCP28_34030 [Niallia sp. NCCP-28]|nr:hypothetical protein NCCP28_34030 [Niallia sp. NCCP-28]
MIIDVRHLAIIIAAIYGGVSSSVCISLIMSVGRLWIRNSFNLLTVLYAFILFNRHYSVAQNLLNT